MSEEISIKRVLVDFLKENKASVFGYLFFSLVTPISNIYLPHLYGQIVSLINKDGINREVKIRFVCIVLLWILVQFFWLAMSAIDTKFMPKLHSYIRKHIVKRVMDAYRQDYSEEEFGGIIAILAKLPKEIERMFIDIRNHVLPMIYMFVFTIGYFTAANPLLGVTGMVSIGAYLGIAVQFSKKCIPVWTELGTSNKTLYGEINDCLGNLLNIYTSNQDEYERERLNKYDAENMELHKSTIQCTARYRFMFNLGYVFLFASVNIVSFYLFSKGLMSLSNVVSVLIISLELIAKMSSFVGSIDRIMHDLTTISNVQNLLDKLNTRKEALIGELYPNLDGDIILENLQIQYSRGAPLKKLNTHISRGSTIVVTGQVGCGKTSMINAIMRLIPYSGTIFINGVDTRQINLGHLRDNVLYVPQNPRLFNRTIYENIAYGGNVTREQVQQVLKHYNIHLFQNLDRRVGKHGQWLSGGQRQLVYLLRCLFKKAPIVLLDEPTASLDTTSKDAILRLITDLLKDRTVIMISHDPDVLKYATDILHIQ